MNRHMKALSAKAIKLDKKRREAWKRFDQDASFWWPLYSAYISANNNWLETHEELTRLVNAELATLYQKPLWTDKDCKEFVELVFAGYE